MRQERKMFGDYQEDRDWSKISRVHDNMWKEEEMIEGYLIRRPWGLRGPNAQGVPLYKTKQGAVKSAHGDRVIAVKIIEVEDEVDDS